MVDPHSGVTDANSKPYTTTYNKKDQRMNVQNENSKVNSKAAGILIAASAIISIVAVALDATTSGKDVVTIMNSMISIQQSHQNVHMIAMACLGGLMFGF